MKKFNKNVWNFYGSVCPASKGNILINVRNGSDSRNIVLADYDSWASFFGKSGIINNAERALRGLDNVYAFKVSKDESVIELWYVNEYNVENYVKWELINLNKKDAYVRWIEVKFISKEFGPWIEASDVEGVNIKEVC